MNTILIVINCAAGFVVLAEALNKLERSQPLSRDLCRATRLVEFLKVLGWSLLAMAAGGALVGPLMASPPPALHEVASLVGFAVLVIRSRLREQVTERSASHIR